MVKVLHGHDIFIMFGTAVIRLVQTLWRVILLIKYLMSYLQAYKTESDFKHDKHTR